MNCEQIADLLDLYALGSLEHADAEAVRTHLLSGCKPCAAKFEQALSEAAQISSAMPLVDPPAGLRDRIAASVGASKPVVALPQKRRPSSLAAWLVAAASLAALAIGITWQESVHRREIAALEASIAETNDAAAQRTAALLSILQAPGTKQVGFDITQSELPHGSLFIHKNLGVAMIVAHLPAAPEGLKYESWVVPKSGAPRPVESFATDKNGFAVSIVRGPVDVSEWKAMAVSLEPSNSTPVKPTKVVFAAPV